MAANRTPPQFSADDLSAPSDFGAKPAPPRTPMRPPMAPPDDEEEDTLPSRGRVTPASVHYHEQEQRCDGCDHLDRGNQCSVLHMPVEPEGGCNAFSSGSPSDDDMDMDTDVSDGEEAMEPASRYGS